ncbi:MAG: hypothetical protein GF398_14225 [Chitinivibrionales bacterium]|nr:hypothetical protein [Chitinivibrionales bacterium]
MKRAFSLDAFVPVPVLVLLLVSTQWAQLPISAGGDPTKMMELLDTYAKGDIQLPKSAPKDAEQDADKLPDTLDSIAPSPGLPQSVYEQMLQRATINPDSILPHLRIYGHEVFEKARPSTFSPGDRISVPSSYSISSGDEIVIVLWGRINEEYRLRVDRDGKIRIPHQGPVTVTGMSFNAMQRSIRERLQSIEGVQASVTMGELRSMHIYLVGEVVSPGMFTLGALTNVTNALFACGGPTANGSLRHIQLRRNGNLVTKLDFYDFLMQGKNNTSLRLKSGDVIVVPIVKKMAAIAGNVRRSALYELKGKTSLSELIDLAGGITPAAWTNRIQIERYRNNEFQVMLDLNKKPEQPLPDFEIQDGDIVKIFPIVEKNLNAVSLSGNVLRPGKYEYHNGMTLIDILPDYSSLSDNAYLEYALIKRKLPPSYRETIIPVNLENALDDPQSEDNIALQPRDRIIVYDREYFEPDREVAIHGAVTTPGRMRLLENMTIRDLIIQAGGLSIEASPERGELYRRSNTSQDIITQVFPFCVSCALEDDPQHNLLLQKFDRVYIRAKKGWRDEKRVTLKGEVIYPGTYVVMEKESLGDIIKRAGGFTSEAYLAAAVFTRQSVRQLEKRRIDDFARQLEMDIITLTTELASKEKAIEAQVLLAQQTKLLSKLRAIKPAGRVVIKMDSPQSYKDFLLEDGDTLRIPKDLSTVSVLGEVFNPATFKLNGEESSVTHYVQLAGGYKENADKRNVYIIRANGSVHTGRMSQTRRTRLKPGDAIVVPPKIRYTSGYRVFAETVATIVNLTSIAANVTSMVLLINSI